MRPGWPWSAAVVLFMAACLGMGRPAASQSQTASVRGADTTARHVVATGTARSPTIAGLVDRLQKSDLIVLVSVGFMDEFHGDTRLLAATRDGWRYVSVRVDILCASDEQIVMLGHELQHATEIADRPDARDQTSLERVMKQIGRRSSGAHRFETDAAVRVGRQVGKELAAWRAPDR